MISAQTSDENVSTLSASLHSYYELQFADIRNLQLRIILTHPHLKLTGMRKSVLHKSKFILRDSFLGYNDCLNTWLSRTTKIVKIQHSILI